MNSTLLVRSARCWKVQGEQSGVGGSGAPRWTLSTSFQQQLRALVGLNELPDMWAATVLEAPYVSTFRCRGCLSLCTGLYKLKIFPCRIRACSWYRHSRQHPVPVASSAWTARACRLQCNTCAAVDCNCVPAAGAAAGTARSWRRERTELPGHHRKAAGRGLEGEAGETAS